MQDFTSFFFILVSVSIFYIYLENKATDVTYVTYKNEEFLVRNRDDKQKAVILLYKIKHRYV